MWILNLLSTQLVKCLMLVKFITKFKFFFNPQDKYVVEIDLQLISDVFF